MKTEKWLEEYIKNHEPVTPAQVYEAGKVLGLTRKEIKAARKWQGKYIDTETTGGVTKWRWAP